MGQATFIAALDQQVACYRRLTELADAQRQYVAQAQDQQLLDLLQQRQEAMQQLAKLEQLTAPMRQQWSQFAGSLEPEARQRVQSLLDQARQLLSQLTQRDTDDALTMSCWRLAAGRATRGGQRMRVSQQVAAKAYGRTAAACRPRSGRQS